MVKCNQKMYDTISDFDFARIREGLVGGLVSESVTLFFLRAIEVMVSFDWAVK